MLADQFLAAAAAIRTMAAADELARKLWRVHAEGHVADADAEALSESIEARRAALAGEVAWDTRISHKAASGLPKASRRAPRLREKVFGLGRPRALDRNAKVLAIRSALLGPCGSGSALSTRRDNLASRSANFGEHPTLKLLGT